MTSKLQIRPDKKFDRFETELATFAQLKLKVTHTFTLGLYIRECVIPAGTLCTTKIHKTEHPFIISLGRCSVWNGKEDQLPQLLGAPFTGVTKPGTRRIIFAHETVIWTTVHRVDTRDVRRIEREIIHQHHKHLPFKVCALTGEQLNKMRRIK